MKNKAVFFDLDGTLNDSYEGIINCVVPALEHFSLPVPSRQELKVFVGPPLRDTFVKFGVEKDRVEEAMSIYRSRYTTVGMFECALFDTVKEMLAELKSKGYRLFVATSKPEEMALEILEKFGILWYFERVCGATLDKSRDEKEKVIEYLLENTPTIETAVMVGDTVFDVEGAAKHNIPTIAVSWGYGNTDDMLKRGAVSVANSPVELIDIIENFMKGNG